MIWLVIKEKKIHFVIIVLTVLKVNFAKLQKKNQEIQMIKENYINPQIL